MDALSININNIEKVTDYASYENLGWTSLPYNLLVVESENVLKIAKNLLYEVQYGCWTKSRRAWLTDNSFKIVLGNETKFYSGIISQCKLNNEDFKKSKRYKSDFYWNNNIGDVDACSSLVGIDSISYKALWNYIADAIHNAESYHSDIHAAIKAFNEKRLKHNADVKEKVFKEKILDLANRIAMPNTIERGSAMFNKNDLWFRMSSKLFTNHPGYRVTVELTDYNSGDPERMFARISIDGSGVFNCKLDKIEDYINMVILMKDTCMQCKW